jgi:hypothetical protein
MTDNNNPSPPGPIWISIDPGNSNSKTVSIPVVTTTSQPTFVPIQQTFTWVMPPVTVTCTPDNTKEYCEEKKKNSDGCVCKKCKELFPYAEPNQDDGTLICYACRMVW